MRLTRCVRIFGAVIWLFPFIGRGQSTMECQPGASIEVTVGGDICADNFVFSGAFSGGGTQCNAALAAVPPAPLLLSPVDSTQNTALTSTLSWSVVAGASTYELQLSLSPVFGSVIVDDTTMTATSRTIGPLSPATTYYWRVRARNDAGYGPYSQTWRFNTTLTTLVGQADQNVPTDFMLSQNFPNPFNPSTVIQYALPRESQVTIRIFNALGQLVATLVDGSREAGYYRIQWNASDVPSGIYFCRMQAGAFVWTEKMILLR